MTGRTLMRPAGWEASTGSRDIAWEGWMPGSRGDWPGEGVSQDRAWAALTGVTRKETRQLRGPWKLG